MKMILKNKTNSDIELTELGKSIAPSESKYFNLTPSSIILYPELISYIQSGNLIFIDYLGNEYNTIESNNLLNSQYYCRSLIYIENNSSEKLIKIGSGNILSEKMNINVGTYKLEIKTSWMSSNKKAAINYTLFLNDMNVDSKIIINQSDSKLYNDAKSYKINSTSILEFEISEKINNKIELFRNWTTNSRSNKKSISIFNYIIKIACK